MSKQNYVLCLAKPIPFKSLSLLTFVERTKDDWQKGRLNLPGGRIQNGETIPEAAYRELLEETGLKCLGNDIEIMGVMEGSTWRIHVCVCPYYQFIGEREQLPAMGRLPEGPIHVLHLREAMHDPRVLTELRIIVSMCLAGATGWHITPTDRRTPEEPATDDTFLVKP